MINYGAVVERPEHMSTIVVGASFEQVLERAKDAIVGEELFVLAEINPRMQLARVGLSMGDARQLLFFHPRFLAPALETTVSAAVEAPLKLALLDLPDGVLVACADPRKVFAAYPTLQSMAAELYEICKRILERVQH